MPALTVRSVLLLSIIFLGGCGPKPPPAEAAPAPERSLMSVLSTGPLSAAAILSHAYFLADDSLYGRDAGSPHELAAAGYIRDQFIEAGLAPAVEGYLQPFHFVAAVELGRSNRLSWRGENEVNLPLGEAYRPLGFSSNGNARGALVFAGYGISSDDPDYDDYAGIEVAGKIVMVMRFSPDGTNPHGSFGDHAPLRKKALIAREKGAAALLVVSGPEEDEAGYLMPLRYDRAGDAGIPVVHITRLAADRMLSAVDLTVAQLQKEINASRLPLSTPVSGVTVSLAVEVNPVDATSHNVLGSLPGSGSLKDEWIVLGAHYDHLGYGGEGSGSLAPDKLAIHNGADDNASGTSVLIALAHHFAQATIDSTAMIADRRSIMFQAYGVEERGLLGSAYVIKNSPVPIAQVVAMLNMDMIGRLSSGKLVIGGAGTSPLWKKLVPEMNIANLPITFDDEGFGGSDHQSYYLADKPVLFFFTGQHKQYHRPTDDAVLLDGDGLASIGSLVADITAALSTRSDRPRFTKPAGSSQPFRGGFAVVVGTIPDYTWGGAGLRLAGTRPGSPADKGGLKAGDILIGFGATAVKSIYDYMYALQAAKAGKTLKVTILRDGEELVLEVTPERGKD